MSRFRTVYFASQGALFLTMLPLSAHDLASLYEELNTEYFEGILPPCQLGWSRRLTRTAGHIYVQRCRITLSVPLLVEVWKEDSVFDVCGVLCDSPQKALREILKHEMIHLWLYVNTLPHGHTAAFRAKARLLGQPKIRHSIESPRPKNGWIYLCAACGTSYIRRKRYGRIVACAKCCKAHSGGKFDERFRLRGTKQTSVPTS